MCSCAIPVPVSETITLTFSPLVVAMRSVPPLLMASLAFRNRFRNHLLQSSRISVDGRKLRAALILHFDPRDLELVLQKRERIRNDLG